MIKAIIFDLDGVIIESAETKTEGFRMLFADYPDALPEIIAYHQRNSGLSRYDKLRYSYEKILGQELPAQKEAELGKRYSQIVLEKVLNAPYTRGALEFLRQSKDHYQLFIASGTPQGELQNIVDHRRLSHFFREVHGSPEQKDEIIASILSRYSFRRKEAVFVGDAESDRISAEKAGISFVARISSDSYELRDYRWQIKDLTELDAVLSSLGSGQEKGG